MKALSKKLKCVCLRNGAEIWVEEEKIRSLFENLQLLNKHRFIKIGDEIVNTADIIGILSAETMEEIERRKMGQWKCKYGFWHQKGEECAHHLLMQKNEGRNN